MTDQRIRELLHEADHLSPDELLALEVLQEQKRQRRAKQALEDRRDHEDELASEDQPVVALEPRGGNRVGHDDAR